MPMFVVFLRGINVGGHIVKKETLHEIFAALGYQNVSTFKQSGNVIFDAASADATFPLDLPLTIPKTTAQILSAKGTSVFSVTHGGGEGGNPTHT